jgi:polyphosphate kinase
VLELAGDADLPVLERVKLCGLVSQNLDEFFSIRVAGLMESVRAGMLIPSPDGRLPMETIAECRDRVLAIQAAQAHLWLHDLKPALAREKIRIVSIEDCARRGLTSLARRFRREIEPLLTPIALGAAAPFPLIPSLALNIGVIVPDPLTRDRRFVRVNVPAGVPRFVPAGHGTFVLVEEVILEFLRATAHERPLPYAVFRVTRDADLSISRDTDDMLEAVEAQLLRRRFANVVRLEVGAGTPVELVALLTRELEISPQQV